MALLELKRADHILQEFVDFDPTPSISATSDGVIGQAQTPRLSGLIRLLNPKTMLSQVLWGLF